MVHFSLTLFGTVSTVVLQMRLVKDGANTLFDPEVAQLFADSATPH